MSTSDSQTTSRNTRSSATTANKLAEPLRTAACGPEAQGIVPNYQDYSYIIVHNNLLKSVLTALTLVRTREDHTEEAIDVEEEEDIDPQGFITAFDDIKNKYKEDLKSHSEDKLKEELRGKYFAEFRKFRHQLTKWYVSGQHLLRKITNLSNTNNYIKCPLSFSPAVFDESLKDKCRNILKTTQDKLEKTISHQVLKRAQDLTNDVSNLLAAVHCEHDNLLLLALMKAFRVVIRTNRHLENERKTFNPDRRNNREPYRSKFFYNSRNTLRRIDTYDEDLPQYRSRYYDKYEEDFPILRPRKYDYRRDKRRDTVQDSELEDEVFHDRYERRPPYQRTYRY